MSAIPKEFLDKAAELSTDSTKPLDGSNKIYVEGSRPDIRVPMREIHLDDTASSSAPRKIRRFRCMTPPAPIPIPR